LTQADAIARLEGQDILCAPIKDMAEAMADPQVLHNEMIIDVPHRRLGTFKTIGNPIKMDATPPRVRREPPDQGQHTDEVLRDLGFSGEEIARFRADGAV
jgi:formyl-CoA transferase